MVKHSPGGKKGPSDVVDLQGGSLVVAALNKD